MLGRALLTWCVVVVALLTGCAATPTPGSTASTTSGSPSGSSADGLSVGTTTVSISSSAVARDFTVHRPNVAAPQAGYPLVLMLHGGLGTGAQAEASYGWDTMADQQGFLVAYPDGLNRTWNAGTCCGTSARDGVDDVAFLTAVVARITQMVSVDANRVYLTGMSNGAMMTYRMACETKLFAAVAPVAGTQLVDCLSAQPVSLLHIHGTADSTVRLDGKRGKAPGFVTGPPIAEVVNSWRKQDGCGAFATSTANGVSTSVANCTDSRTVEWILVAGAGHQWPGSTRSTYAGADQPSDALSATSVIWAFFAAHPRT